MCLLPVLSLRTAAPTAPPCPSTASRAPSTLHPGLLAAAPTPALSPVLLPVLSRRCTTPNMS